jgi:hypothetical protein
MNYEGMKAADELGEFAVFAAVGRSVTQHPCEHEDE